MAYDEEYETLEEMRRRNCFDCAHFQDGLCGKNENNLPKFGCKHFEDFTILRKWYTEITIENQKLNKKYNELLNRHNELLAAYKKAGKQN